MILLDAVRLCLALHVLPDVRPVVACRAAVPILLAAGPDAPLVAALAWRESRMEPLAVNPRTLAAGPLGVVGFDVRRGELAGYVAGVRVLRAARAWCVRRREPGTACTLAAYVGGPRLVRRGGYRGAAVLRRAAVIRRAMQPARLPADRSGA